MKRRLGLFLAVFLGFEVMLGYGFQDQPRSREDLNRVEKLEVSAFSTSFKTDLGYNLPLRSYSGLGGRLTFNLTPNVAVEAETAYMPESMEQKLIMLSGPKVGIRRSDFGLFGKVRPGIFSIGWGTLCLAEKGRVCPQYTAWEHHFALDLGGVVEIYNFGVYKSDRLFFRMDVGDTFTKFGYSYTQGGFGESKRVDVDRPRHNLQVSIGAGYRF